MPSLREQALKLTELRYQLLPKLFQQLEGKNSCLGDLLQCHLFTESLLEELIRLALDAQAEAVLSMRLTYDQKLTLASKLTLAEDLKLLPDYVVGSLRKLSGLRNQVVHRYDAEITPLGIRELFVGLEHELPYPDESGWRG